MWNTIQQESPPDYLHEFMDNDADETPVVTDDITKYLQMKVPTLPSDTSSNNFDWWRINSCPLTRLSIAAKVILSMPASSAARDQSLNVAGSTISQTRTALYSDMIEDGFLCIQMLRQYVAFKWTNLTLRIRFILTTWCCIKREEIWINNIDVM